MTPVDQEHFYCAEPRHYGDCTRAVIASLLDLPLVDVPHFLQDADGKVYEYYTAIEAFLEARGFEIDWQTSIVYHWRPGDPDLYHILTGPSPRHAGIGHAVVGMNGKHIVHDPHPDRTGLAEPKENWRVSVIKRKS